MVTRLAFVLGNGLYTSEKAFPKIDHAPQDAARVFETLTAPTGLFSADKSVIAKNQSIQELRSCLRAFFARVKREDFVLIYFTCHAELIGGRRLVLAMKDTEPTELAATGFVADQLIPYLDEKDVQRYVIVLDCCRAGAALASPGIRQRGTINEATVHLPGGVGKVIVASSLEYQLAHESDRLGHGVFSFYFIEGLSTGEAVSTQKEFIDIRSLCNWIVSSIKEKHSELAQDPVISGEDEAGELIIGRNPRFNPGRIMVHAAIMHRAPGGWFLPGDGKFEWFKDHESGPEMVIVPAGEFKMGSAETELERYDCPQHCVTIARPFAVSRHAVTRGQFAAFVDNTGYKTEGGALVPVPREGEEILLAEDGTLWKTESKASWRNPWFPQEDNHPVVCVSWEDAKAFAAWLSSETGRSYRLLTEAEWEYATRADTETRFWWGPAIHPYEANYDPNTIYRGVGRSVPVDRFSVNAWGLYQVHGNVWEWCEDIWHANYDGAPSDGSAWLQGGDGTCQVLRGGSWDCVPEYLRAAHRKKQATNLRVGDSGLRVGCTLTP